MGETFTATDQAAWRRWFLAGAARSGEAPSALPPIAALALIAQRERFERPAPRGALNLGEAVEDPRPILPGTARIPFRRMLRQKNGLTGQITVRAAFAALAAEGLRPHPFDLAMAEPWMSQVESFLGPSERAYRARLSGAPAKSPAELLWEDLSPGQRVSVANSQRQADPAAGRALVEQHLADETAATRADLVHALSAGLGPDDRALLTSLLSDRSQAVKAAAQVLLARIPGEHAYAERLRAAADACVAKKVGVFGGRRRLELKVTPKGPDPLGKVLELFQGVRLSDLAGRLDAKVDDLLDETEEPIAGMALAACGLAEGRTDVLARLTPSISAYGAPFLTQCFAKALADLPREARAALLGGYLEALPPETLYPPAAWGALVAAIEGPLPVSTARRLLRSAAAQAAVADAQDEQKARTAVDALTGLAAATPRVCAGELCARLAALGPTAGSARDFADFLSALP